MQLNPPGLELASERVVLAVAEHTDTDPLELPCLFDVIDPEALDVFIHSADDGQVQFQYAGCTVTVHSDGTVDVVETPLADTQRGTTEGNEREYVQD